jgi:hypothetical protein
MRHQDLQLNHRLESWVYANALARTGASGFVAGDIGRISYQQDNGTYWRLYDTTPFWIAVGGAPNYFAATTAITRSLTNTAQLMMGIPGTITPSYSGRILISFDGGTNVNTAGAFVDILLRYGTGTKPAFLAALSGTAFPFDTGLGGAGVPANCFVPVSNTGIATSLTLGTPYWMDISASVSAGTATITGIINTIEF